MTRWEWRTCRDPVPMLHALRGVATERRLRLWVVACCRRAHDWPQRLRWGWARLSRARRAPEAAEGYADGLVPGEALEEVRRDALAAFHGQAFPYNAPACAAFHAAGGPRDFCWLSCLLAVKHAADAALCWGASQQDESAAQADLLREVFGPYPFRPVGHDPRWLDRDGGLVPRLAEAVLSRRPTLGPLDRAALLVLADAAEEAGCIDTDLLGHLRGPGPHVAGCWAVDPLAGRE